MRPAPPLRPQQGRWTQPARREPSLLGPQTFLFLNRKQELTFPAGWDDSALEKLWLYNLHYFDDLNAREAERRADWHRALLARWIADSPPGQGTGWEPYPLSLRLVNWIKWALGGHALPEEALHSLAVQARYLHGRLEWHLLGNHLFENIKALIAAGLFFAGPEAERWLALGLRLLDQELHEQILPDGGHFERSPMYHSILTEDLLDLINLTAVYPEAFAADRAALPGLWMDTVQRMRRWLKTMCHPDGQIAFFNDAAWDIAPAPAEMDAYAGRLGLPSVAAPEDGLTHLQQSGYIRMQCGPAVALLDVGPVGPDYLPGHAHADTLSFELSLYGARVLVNAGTSTYVSGPQRQWERSTAAHNTVTVDGQDSSEVWGGFRVARRARPAALCLSAPNERPLQVSAAHDGYLRLPGRVLHRRSWSLTARSLEIRDTLEGRFSAAVARFHLHPCLVPQQTAASPEGIRFLFSGHTLIWRPQGVAASLEQSAFHPGFGLSQPTICLTARFQEAMAASLFTWE
ncbi:MAG TPA: alginate lyase family protein [Chthonomonadaceae bacterium]|nr:alginate lyase family protein [Chthonomonadaceae bacterium]